MKHVVWKFYYDFEKEEKFLNQMSEKGLALTGYTWGRYVFEDAPKGEYIYRIELLENPLNHPTSREYLSFMEETGVERIASYNRWVYFRKKAADGEFEIYSDIDSKIKHYKRIRVLFSLIILLNLMAGWINFFSGNMETSIGVPAVNSYIAILSFSIVILLLVFLVIPLGRKINALEREKAIRE